MLTLDDLQCMTARLGTATTEAQAVVVRSGNTTMLAFPFNDPGVVRDHLQRAMVMDAAAFESLVPRGVAEDLAPDSLQALQRMDHCDVDFLCARVNACPFRHVVVASVPTTHEHVLVAIPVVHAADLLEKVAQLGA